MGWFDDESEDEEETIVHPTTKTGGEEEEEDPLDAYMNSLDTNAKNSTTSKSIRLDVVNEEEATSHWKQTPLLKNNNNPIMEEEEENELTLTFHKAGDTKKQPNNHQDDEEEEDDYDWTKQQHKQKKTTIAPLQVPTTNTTTEYEPIQKCIWNDSKQPHPKNDEQSWRKKYSIQIKSLSSSHHSTPNNYSCPYITKQELQTLQQQNDSMLNSIQELTPVQSQAIPILLQGKDVIVTSKTGSGKTFTYLWTIKLHLQTNPNHIALILVPTRELAQQVAKNTSSHNNNNDRKKEVLIMTGGSSWNKEQSTYELIKQWKAHKPNIWVATPGRLIQMVQTKSFHLHKISFLVLDEADKMLDMGFESQVTSILQNLNPQRQTCMMSATFHNKLEQTARKWLQNPIRVAVGKTGSSSEHVQQHVFIVPSLEAKKLWMKEMLPTFVPLGRTLIFCATKQMCDTLAQYINQNNNNKVAVIHGDCHQSDRYKAIQQFSKQRIDALIASDVAARGLDIDNVRTVINFEIPKNYDAYIHRIGRAGRMNTKTNEVTVGTAYNLFDSTQKKDVDFANTLLNALTREGKTDTITEEWRNLAMRSNYYGTTKKQHKFAGLGFTDPTDNDSESRYGGSSSRPNKRSRWG